MEIVYHETIVHDTIVLDDKRFIGCAVSDCKVVHAGGKFETEETTFENCTPILAGDALNTAEFIKKFGVKI